jgi:nucleotide-binding universal stress UspA family protein
MEHRFVIAGTDGSRQSYRAVEWAAREAAMRAAALQIVCVPAVPPPMSRQPSPRGTPENVTDMIIQAAEEALAKAADHAAQAEPRLAVETALRPGPPAPALAKAATDALLLVIGSRGGGSLAALGPGSVSRYLAARAVCPVVLVPEQSTAIHREVVVGIRDLDQPTAIGFAFEEASLRSARLRVVHAWRWFLPVIRSAAAGQGDSAAGDITAEATQWLADSVALWREKYPDVNVTQDVVHASACRALAARSASSDLIVLGRSASDDIGRRGGHAVIQAVLGHAHCPVAIVPG